MKIRHHLLTLAILLSPLLASAQFGPSGGEDDLYFPPTLTIGMGQDESIFMRLYYQGQTDEELPPIETSDELVFTREIDRYQRIVPLPIIFFNSGSSTLPKRYQTFNSTFDADEYDEESDIDVTYREFQHEYGKYYEILNILGSRLARDKQITIELQGGYSTEPGEDRTIAQERSEVVRDYFTRIWRVAPERITILEPRLFVDSLDHALKQEEARSVRIYPSDRRLLDPVIYSNSSIDLGVIAVTAALQPNMPLEDIAELRLSIASGDDLLGETVMPIEDGLIEGADRSAPVFNWTGMWFLPRLLNSVDEGLSVNMIIVTTDGRLRHSNTTLIPVRIEEPRPDDEEAMRERAVDVRATEAAAERAQPAETTELPDGYEEAYDEYLGYDDEYDGEYAYDELDDGEYEVPVYASTWSPVSTYDISEYYRKDSLYTGPLLFFNSGDSTLDRLQELWLEDHVTAMRGYLEEKMAAGFDVGATDEDLAAIAMQDSLRAAAEEAGDTALVAKFAEITGPEIGTIRWGVEVSSDIEVTEDPELDNAVLVTGRSFYESSIAFGMGLLNDPDFTISLYIFPKVDPNNPPDMERISEEITRQMFGTRAHELEAMQRDARSIYREEEEGFRDLRIERLDSIRAARCRGVGSWIAKRLDSFSIDTIVTDRSQIYTWNANLASIDWLPEARFYSREAEAELVMFRRSLMRVWEDEGDEEDYDYEIEDLHVSDDAEPLPEAAEETPDTGDGGEE